MHDPKAGPKAETALEEYVERFHALLRGVAENLAIDQAKFLETKTIVVDGVNIAFIHYGAFDPDYLTCCLELGEVRPEATIEAYRVMLEQNVSLPGACGSFGLLPDSGKPVLLLRVRLAAELTSAQLLSIVELLMLRYVALFTEPQQPPVAPQEALLRQRGQQSPMPQGPR
jgi:hypothetical protein